MSARCPPMPSPGACRYGDAGLLWTSLVASPGTAAVMWRGGDVDGRSCPGRRTVVAAGVADEVRDRRRGDASCDGDDDVGDCDDLQPAVVGRLPVVDAVAD